MWWSYLLFLYFNRIFTLFALGICKIARLLDQEFWCIHSHAKYLTNKHALVQCNSDCSAWKLMSNTLQIFNWDFSLFECLYLTNLQLNCFELNNNCISKDHSELNKSCWIVSYPNSKNLVELFPIQIQKILLNYFLFKFKKSCWIISYSNSKWNSLCHDWCVTMRARIRHQLKLHLLICIHF